MGGSVNTGGQTQNQTQNQSQNQTSTTTPWAPAIGSVSGILGNLTSISPFTSPAESSALATLSGIGAAGNPFTSGISNVANTLLDGGGPDRTGVINDAYTNYLKAIAPLTNPANLDPRNTPGFSDALSATNSDITNQINSQFAAAGRDLSGMNTQTLARGLSQGEGQLISNQYNANADRLASTASNVYGAGATTTGILSALDEARLGNMQAGVNVAGDAWNAAQSGPMLQLQAEAQRRGIPLQTLAAEMGIALPAGQAFASTNSTGNISGIMNGQTQNTSPLWQQITGALIGGAGLLGGVGAFGKNGWLNFGKD
jgi:hypothetical protein